MKSILNIETNYKVSATRENFYLNTLRTAEILSIPRTKLGNKAFRKGDFNHFMEVEELQRRPELIKTIDAGLRR